MNPTRKDALTGNDLELVELENHGYVAAGKTVAFQPPAGTTTVPLPPALAREARKGLVGTMTAHGRSLEGVGIFDGDVLIVRRAESRREIGRDTICIVYIPATGEVLAKKIRFMDDVILLRSSNAEVPDIKVKATDVDVRGIVLFLYRKPDEYGRFDRGYVNDIPF